MQTKILAIVAFVAIVGLISQPAYTGMASNVIVVENGTYVGPLDTNTKRYLFAHGIMIHRSRLVVPGSGVLFMTYPRRLRTLQKIARTLEKISFTHQEYLDRLANKTDEPEPQTSSGIEKTYGPATYNLTGFLSPGSQFPEGKKLEDIRAELEENGTLDQTGGSSGSTEEELPAEPTGPGEETESEEKLPAEPTGPGEEETPEEPTGPGEEETPEDPTEPGDDPSEDTDEGAPPPPPPDGF